MKKVTKSKGTATPYKKPPPDPPPPDPNQPPVMADTILPTIAVVAVPGVVDAVDRLTAVIAEGEPPIDPVGPGYIIPDYTAVLASIATAINEQTSTIQAHTAALREQTDSQVRSAAETVEAIDANTKAVLEIAEHLEKPVSKAADTITMKAEVES